MLKLTFMAKTTKCYTLCFLMIENPWLVFRLKHENSKQNFFDFFMEKMLIIQFHIWKKCLFCYFHKYTFAL